ncbi:histidine kinase [Massilia sp. H-1]|nr:histidine kinase [Massilia sp. H-1]
MAAAGTRVRRVGHRRHRHRLDQALLFAIPVTLVYGCAAGFSSYYLCRAYPLADKAIVAILAVFGFSAMISAMLWTAFAIMWNGLWQELGVPLTAPLRATVFGLGVVLYGLSAIAHYLAIEFQRARSAERRELESQLMAQEAELRMLRTQIDPHFLFNSLNSISALTSQDPKRAREMTLQLAEFFRHTLGLEAHRKVTLEAEAKLLMHFLAIEKVRFGARLMVEQDIAEDANACLLPPMILQPLVENAVKHGIGQL